MTINLITGCSNKSHSDIDAYIETTVISDEELYQDARKITEPLPDNSIATINEIDDHNMIGEVTAINSNTLTITIEEVNNANPSKAPTEGSISNGTDTLTAEHTLTVTDETFIHIQNDSETTTASFSDINVGDMIKFKYLLSETGEEKLFTITILNMSNKEITPSK